MGTSAGSKYLARGASVLGWLVGLRRGRVIIKIVQMADRVELVENKFYRIGKEYCPLLLHCWATGFWATPVIPSIEAIETNHFAIAVETQRTQSHQD